MVVHLTAAHRLRSALPELCEAEGPGTSEPIPLTQLPLLAEAVFDPSRRKVAEAAVPAQSSTASEAIRAASVRIDRARGRLRKTDPDEALTLWRGLVSGRWSLVDWFDTDGRRFIVAKANAPDLGDPRGLTQRELPVATYAVQGETLKLIGYRFDLSPSQVSRHLRAAMRKLGARTQAELVEKMRATPLRSAPSEVLGQSVSQGS